MYSLQSQNYRILHICTLKAFSYRITLMHLTKKVHQSKKKHFGKQVGFAPMLISFGRGLYYRPFAKVKRITIRAYCYCSSF